MVKEEEMDIIIKDESYGGESTVCCAFNKFYGYMKQDASDPEPIVWYCTQDPNGSYNKDRAWYVDQEIDLLYVEPSCIGCNTRQHRERRIREERDCVYAAWKGWLINPPLETKELYRFLGRLRMDKMQNQQA